MNTAAAAAFVFVFIIAAIGILIGIAFYVLCAYGLYSIGKKNNVENAWMAWIPVVNYYVVGKVIKEYKVFNYSIPHIEWSIVLIPVIATVISCIPIIGWLIGWAVILVAAILFYMFLHKFYYMLSKENAVLYLVLSIVFSGIAMPVIFMILKNKVASSEEDYRYPFSNINITVNKDNQ